MNNDDGYGDWLRDELRDRKWEEAQERKHERPTPITDAFHLKQGLTHAEYLRHARNLERQLAAKTEECAGWEQQFRQLAKNGIVDSPGGLISERATPITDRNQKWASEYGKYSFVVASELCSDLERQLAQTKDNASKLVASLQSEMNELERQLAEAREQRDHYIAENNRLLEELKAERALADRLARWIQNYRKAFEPAKVDPECECDDCKFVRLMDAELDAWKEARKEPITVVPSFENDK